MAISKGKSLPKSDYHICYWCGRKTTQLISRKKTNLIYETYQMHTHTDHIIPFSYSRSNAKINLVYACNFCNSHKSMFVFESEKDVREYLKRKWYEETNEVFTMLTDIQPEKDMAEILLKGMSLEKLATGTAYRMPEVWRNNKTIYCQMCGRRKSNRTRWLVDGIPLCSRECWDEYIDDAFDE